ncbi:AP-3 complex subunit mu-1 [Fusarium oxysporum f. sp. albedinis]|nr:AP-3 complex subunit mu-1 [Fusarium oxysporum f. sp. albedinis]
MIFQFISFRDWITIRDLDQWWSSTDQEAVCFERYTAETLRKSMGYKQYYETPMMSVGYIIVNTAYVNNMTRRPVTYMHIPRVTTETLSSWRRLQTCLAFLWW